MQNYIFISGFFLFIFAYYLYLRRRRHHGVLSRSISLNELAEVYSDISEQAEETSFSVFVIPRPNQASIEVQFSVEKGITGLDWILESEANKEERPKVEQYFASQGFGFREKEMNNWHYLRIEEGDIVRLCTGLIKDLFDAKEIILKYGGFRLRPLSKTIKKRFSIR
jgi:hypothetical protein